MTLTTEQTLLHHLQHWVPAHPDDWQDDAWWEPATRRVYTVDTFVEGVHFRCDWMDWQAIGHKCAAAAWSDVAAMGARPLLWLVSLGLPADLAADLGAIEALYRGMLGVLSNAGYPQAALIGGDTVRSPQLSLSLTAIGEVPVGHSVGLRHLAQLGDVVLTTGWSGLSGLGLVALEQGLADCYPAAVLEHTRPTPRFEQGLALSALNQRVALMDTSDGLADAALRIAQASQVRLVLEEKALPLHAELLLAEQSGHVPSARELALYGGEDFELLACVDPALWASLPEDTQRLFTVIGHVAPVEAHQSAGATLRQANGTTQPLTPERTFQHFSAVAGELRDVS